MRRGCGCLVGLMVLVAAAMAARYLTRAVREHGAEATASSLADRAQHVMDRAQVVERQVTWLMNRGDQTLAALKKFRPPRYPAFAGVSPAIPFRDRLEMVHSQWQPTDKGDFEAAIWLQRVSKDTMALVMTSFRKDGRVPKTYAFPISALRTAAVFTTSLCYDDPCHLQFAQSSGRALIPDGEIGFFLPAKAFADLRRTGRATLRERFQGSNGTARATAPQPRRVAFPVVLNGRPSTVAALHIQARDDGLGDSLDLHVLDDPSNPLLLELWWWNWDRRYLSGLRATRIAFPSESRAIETELARDKRAVVYGIYFAFGSSELLPASEPVLREIAGALSRNADWRLRIEGHTDSIGTAESNRVLSERRSAAVRDALVARYRIDARRLSVAGFGATVPVDSNSTLIGRARNRRVELIRQ